MSKLPPIARLPVLLTGLLSLVGGVLAGLGRMGWDVPTSALHAAGMHGALMVAAFFGTVISLERAVAVEYLWAYLAPLAAASGGALLLVGAPASLAQYLILCGAVVMTATSIYTLRRLLAPCTLVLVGAATCWAIGNLTWLLTDSASTATPWWFAFLVLTIAGERLELSRLVPTPRVAQALFLPIVIALPSGAALALCDERHGLILFSAALLSLSCWLLCFDIAAHNVRREGLPRFIAVCLLAGYVWLACAGLLGLGDAFLPGDAWRDSAIHALGVGFVFSMILGHAPIVLPAVARVHIPYHVSFYLPLLVLHAALSVRVFGGIRDHFALQRIGGLANAYALLLFFAVLSLAVLRGRTSAGRNSGGT